MRRSEFEYAIPVEDARELERLASGTVVEKVRHVVPHAGHDWEVDQFGGENAGLVLAEVEIAAEDVMPELPPWIGREVTDDRRYYSGSLAQQPFSRW